MLIERWRKPRMLSSMCEYVARLQFDSSSEKDNLCGTVMMRLNLRCFDQCHCVRSHGKSSSQDWRKIVVQSKFDPWIHVLVFAKLSRAVLPFCPFWLHTPYLPELAWTSLLAKFPSPLHKSVGIVFSCVCSSFARSWNRPCQRQHAQGMPSWARSA